MSKRLNLLFVISFLLAMLPIFAVDIAAGGTVTQNFDAIGSTATASLPTDWKVEKSAAIRTLGSYSSALGTTNYAAGNDMSINASNGVYNMGAGVATTATDRSIGFISSSSATKSGNLMVKLTNNGTTNISAWTLNYNVEKYRMGTNAAGFSVQMYYSIDGTTWTSAGSDFLTSFTGGDTSNGGYTPAPGETQSVTNKTFSQSVAAGASMYLAWSYSVTTTTTSSNAQALAIDDISIMATGGAAPPATISATGTLLPFTAVVGTPSAAQTYTLSGTALTAPISVSVSAPFEVRIPAGTWANTLQAVATYNGLIEVRYNPTAAGTHNSQIVHSSTGATTVNLNVSGTATAPPPVITVTGTLNTFSAYVGTPSAVQTYTLSGANLTANITIVAPAGFEVSTNAGVNYSATGSVASTFSGSIYIRLIGTSIGTYSGNVTHNSTGATEVTLAVSGAVSAAPTAQILMDENFAYPVGTLLSANGWTSHSGAGTLSPTIVSPGLSYTGYPLNGGLAVQTLGNGEDNNVTFDAQTSGSIYTALLINVTSASTTGDYVFHMGANPLGSDFKGRLFVQKDASNNLRFGVTKAAGYLTTGAWTGYTYSMATTYLIIMKYTILSGTANDTVELWVNPATSGAEPTALLTALDPTGTDAFNIGSVAIRQGSSTPLAIIDGIRVANTWTKLFESVVYHPVITVTGTLDPFVMIAGVPSERQFYHVSGSELSSNINISAPAGFELSETGDAPWTSTLALASSFDGDVFVRMNATTEGLYSGNITHSSGTAVARNVFTEGEALAPTGTINVTQMFVPFTATVGTPSAAQTYSLSGTNLGAELFVTVATPFEVSVSGSNTWQTQLILPSSFNGTISVRLNTSTGGTYNATVSNFSDGAVNVDFAISGTVSLPSTGSYLFFSEYVEGGSNRKAVEIFNGTGAPVDLSNYMLKKQTNGVGLFGGDLALTGTLANNDVYVVVLSNATGSLMDEPYVDLATTSSVLAFNGNDCVALYYNSVQIDVIGVVDQVANWGTDMTLVRKANVSAPRTDWTLTEWDSYPVDTVSYLGSHVYTPGTTITATPVFNPGSGLYSSAQNVSITCATSGATIRYTTDGTDPSLTVGTIYSTPIAISTNRTLKAIAYKTGYSNSTIATATYSFPTFVSTVAQLRSQVVGTTVYKLNVQALVSFKQTYRNQMYIQDATAGILIDDFNGTITTVYNVGDGITGVTGTLNEYNGMLQFTPTSDPGTATSTGNAIAPQEISLGELVTNFENYESRLVKLSNVTLTGSGNFANGIVYPMSSGASNMSFRSTFYDVDYIGTPIPTVAQIIIGIPNSRTIEGNVFTARKLADFSNYGTVVVPEIVTAGNLVPFSAVINTASAVQTYALAGTALTAAIQVVATSPYQIRESGGSTWSSTLSLASTFNGTIEVRFNPTAVGTFNGTITHSSTGVSNVVLNTSGTATNPTTGQNATDLIFSEYLEGSSNNKAIEIFNGTGSDIDLINYKLELYSNGSATASSTLSMSGTLMNGSVYVVTNSLSIASILAVSNISHAVANFNGDDALAIKKINPAVYVDIFGRIGNDPGTAWTGDNSYTTLDKTLVRKSSVYAGITVNPTGTGPTAFTTLTTEWDMYDMDTVSYLGSHTFDGGVVIVVNPPTLQASNIVLYPAGESITAEWNPGNGAKRIVKINTTNSFTNPVDGTSPAANSEYSGSGEQVIYNGATQIIEDVPFNGVDVTGLNPNTTYWFRVYDYNGSGINTKYITSTATNNPVSTTTLVSQGTGYYAGISGYGATIKAGLHTLLRQTHTTQYSYDALWQQLPYTDEDPNNSNNIIELYTGWSVPKSNYGGGTTEWNREHTWSKSHGDFAETRPAGTDLHHLRPCDSTVNSAKSNKDFAAGGTQYVDGSPYGSYSANTGNYTTSTTWEPRDADKGDVARMIMYMAVRYEGTDTSFDLEAVDLSSTSGPYYGKLSTLLQWSVQDPPDAREIQRNNRIAERQGNRNPFVDYPVYAQYIWTPVPQTATAITQTGFTANWSTPITATKYYLEVATDSLFTSFVTGYSNYDANLTTSKAISGLAGNATYYYRLRSYFVSGYSMYSPFGSVTLASPTGSLTATSAAMNEGNLNGMTITLTLSNTTFTDNILQTGNFVLNNAPAGVSIASVSYVNSTRATIILGFNGMDFDSNISTMTVTINNIELATTSNITSNNLNITAFYETPLSIDVVNGRVLLNVTAVPGAISYKIFASNGPSGTYPEVTNTGIFTPGTPNRWTETAATQGRKFFKAVAIR